MATLERIRSKNFTLGIVGLGYVGMPLGCAFSRAGVRVLGYDLDDKLSDGFEVVGSLGDLADCDAIIVCVPTPMNKNTEPDLSMVEGVCRELAGCVKKGALVVLESTTWPGTMREVVQPIFEGKGVFLCYSPERCDPGVEGRSIESIPKLVAGVDEKSLELGAALYGVVIDEVVQVRSPEVAEAAKLVENAYRAVNIALVNELKIVFKRMGIDIWEVLEAAATKPFGYKPFWPGPGLGGHCISIDPYYLSWKAKEYKSALRLIDAAAGINREMPRYVVVQVQDCLNELGKALKMAKILVWGVAYKPNIDDSRESPSIDVMERLKKKGAVVDYYDPHVAQLDGVKSVEPSSDYDCFLLMTVHEVFSADQILSYGVPVVDTRHMLPDGKNVYRA